MIVATYTQQGQQVSRILKLATAPRVHPRYKELTILVGHRWMPTQHRWSTVSAIYLVKRFHPCNDPSCH